MSANKQLHVIPSPYIKAPLSYKRMMLDKCIAVSILALGAIYFWGMKALIAILVSTVVAVATEWIAWKLMKKEHRLHDFSAIIIGISFALLLPIGVPLWVITLGSVFSVLFGKMAFGGIAYTPFPPVAVGYAMVSAAWGKYLNPGDIVVEGELIDPLTELKSFGIDSIELQFTDYLMGNQLAVMGATSLGIILFVLVFMLIRRIMSWYVAFGYGIGITACAYLAYMSDPSVYPNPTFVLSTGTVLLSLILLLSDFSSIPTAPLGRIVYGFLVGAIVIFIRTYTDIFDGTPLAILLASFLVPYCDMLRIKKQCRGGY